MSIISCEHHYMKYCGRQVLTVHKVDGRNRLSAVWAPSAKGQSVDFEKGQNNLEALRQKQTS